MCSSDLMLSPWTGTLADRWNPRRIMMASDLVRAVLVLFLVSASAPSRVWIVSFALGCASSFFQPAMSIALPLLVPREGLAAAYARLQQSMQVVRIASPAVASALVSGFSERACYYVDSASFLFSAAMLLTLRCVRPAHSAAPAATSQWGAGVRFLLADARFARLVLALAAATFADRKSTRLNSSH